MVSKKDREIIGWRYKSGEAPGLVPRAASAAAGSAERIVNPSLELGDVGQGLVAGLHRSSAELDAPAAREPGAYNSLHASGQDRRAALPTFES